MVPSVSVSRQGLVIPFEDCLLFTILAVSRNCLIWSLVRFAVRFGWSEATTKRVQVRQSTTTSPRHRRRNSFIEDTSLRVAEAYSLQATLDNINRTTSGVRRK